MPSSPAVEILDPASLDATFVTRWRRLEALALEPNAYLSPDFVLPALRHVDRDPSWRIVAVSGPAGDGELLVLGLFRSCRGNRAMPLPHLQGHRGEHGFLGGLLVHREAPGPALDAWFGAMRAWRHRWHGFTLARTWADGAQAGHLRDAARRNGALEAGLGRTSRAVLRLPVDADVHLERLSANQRQNLRRRDRRFDEPGDARREVLRGAGVDDDWVEQFLALEHRGWKGEKGTSLRAQPAHEHFFREMCAGFAGRGELIVTRLSQGGRPVALTCNLASAGAGFAFKVGWDPDFAKLSPGTLCELAFLREAARVVPDLHEVDSGAVAGSYMDELWPDRRDIHDAVYATTGPGRGVLRALQWWRGRRRRKERA